MLTITQILEKKRAGTKIVMLTAYDYPLAVLVEAAGVDMILIGDSGGMVSLGYKDTLPVTMSEMVSMVRAVRRGAPDTFLIADMPFMSYQVSDAQAVENAGRLVKDGGADAVKLEGGSRMASRVGAVVQAGILVQGHIGLTPQNATQLGGFKLQGKTSDAAKALLRDALDLESAGIFSLILEAVPVRLADIITRRIAVPTIGTGSGNVCDGQNLITPDLLGYYNKFCPRYVKRYADLAGVVSGALRSYREDVLSGQFPAVEHTYPLRDDSFLDGLGGEAD